MIKSDPAGTTRTSGSVLAAPLSLLSRPHTAVSCWAPSRTDDCRPRKSTAVADEAAIHAGPARRNHRLTPEILSDRNSHRDISSAGGQRPTGSETSAADCVRGPGTARDISLSGPCSPVAPDNDRKAPQVQAAQRLINPGPKARLSWAGDRVVTDAHLAATGRLESASAPAQLR